MPHRIDLRARDGQHYIYSGRSILVTDLNGWVTGRSTEGFYYNNTRLLCRDEVTIEGRPLKPAAVSPVGPDGFLAYYEALESESVPAGSIYLEVRRSVAEGLRSEYVLTNFDRDRTISFRLLLHLEADFADSDDTERGISRQSAPVSRQWDAHDSCLLFTYCHPRLRRRSAVRLFDADAPVEDEGDALAFELTLAPRESTAFVTETTADPAHDWQTPDSNDFTGGLADVREALRAEVPALTSSNETVNRAWHTAVEDLASLPLGLAGTPAVPTAGLPLYQQFFGRDSLTIGWQSLMATPRFMRDSLIANAGWQGRRIDDLYDEEPGKMIHQARWGPLSALGVDVYSRYYGDWATPVDFLVGLGQYLMWTKDVATVRGLLPAARAALDWTEYYGDKDGDGFLEYETRSYKGVKHQGWKDSDDAIVDAEGRLIEPPIAACEIQGYWYAGLQQAGVAFVRCGDAAFGLRLLRRAADLRRRFDAAFWVPEQQSYAMALGADGRRGDPASSNAGHLLAAGIVDRKKAKAVAGRLMAPDMFSGWGIRTLSSENPFFNPFSYHRGSVWPVEQGTIAFGFARYGLWDELHQLTKGVFDLTDLFVANRLPEAVAGMPRDDRHPHPGIYPESCEPQGWSASMVVMLVQSLLGLRALAPLNLLLVDPHLPEWLDDLRLEGLRVGGTLLDLHFTRRRDGRTDFRTARRDGPCRVLRQPVPNSEPSLVSRARAILA
jgi:glycogen debranching enzyme